MDDPRNIDLKFDRNRVSHVKPNLGYIRLACGRVGILTKKKVLKHFILPEIHFKGTLFFPIWSPLTHPTTQPRDYQSGESKRGEWGLIKVKNKFTLKFILGDFECVTTSPACLTQI